MSEALVWVGRAVGLRAGWLAALACLLLATSVGCTGAAALPSRPVSLELAQLNRIRESIGLTPLAPNPVAEKVVARIALRDTEDVQPAVLDSQPACVRCELVFEDGRGYHPRVLYARRTGKGTIGFGLWRRGWPLTANLSVFFPTTALVLDPRARTFAAAPTPTGMLLVAVTVDPRAAFVRPVRWPTGMVDPARQLWTEVVLPPGLRGDARLVERRPTGSMVAAYPLADTVGVAGARLVAFGLNTELSYRRRYAVRVGAVSVPIATRSMPTAFRRRSWSFVAMRPAERRAFLHVVRGSPPLLRRILEEIDGAVVVAGNGLGCSLADACEHEDDGRVTMSFRRPERFQVAHEIGHAVFDLALDEPGRKAFVDAFVRAGWHGRCRIPPAEIFADQLAFWALGGVPTGTDSYSNRMFLSSGRFAALLRLTGAYRPLPTFGPLER